MHTDHLIQNLENRADKNGLKCQVEKPAVESAIAAFEERNGVTMPGQVKWFYRVCNGLKVEAPPLEIKSVENLNTDANSKIIFAIIDKRHRICFDVSKQNAASQWNILNFDTGFILTMTMESFWTRSYLKKRILVQGVGGPGFQTTDILRYFEDLKTGPNIQIGPKDFFEIASNKIFAWLEKRRTVWKEEACR